MDQFQKLLAEYADLLIQVGLNVQPGQTIIVRADLSCAPLARACTEACYRAGAAEVINRWSDDITGRMRYLYAAEDTFDRVPSWTKEFYDQCWHEKYPCLAIVGSDPEWLKGVDAARILRWSRVMGKASEGYFKAQTNNEFQWLVAACPTQVWADKVFPEQENSLNLLWDAVMSAVSVNGDGQAVARWKKKVADSSALVGRLNAFQFTQLHYSNSLGTDLTVGLPEGHYWTGASELAANGVEFVANMPSEEIFTLPHRERVNGRVYASKPLALNGNLVDGFWLELQQGKIVDLHADLGEEYLRQSIATDEGASYLGEVALVPFDSPINNTGILFYETLFDENASCHFAFGEAYPCIHGADKLTPKEQLALGINQSMNHVDFMVGTPDLRIVGTTGEGAEIPVFENGNFVI